MNRAATLLGLGFAFVACDSARETLPTSRSATDPIVGAYSLTLTAGSECGVIPEAIRNRTYSAKIDGHQQYVVTLSDATFLTEAESPDGVGACRAYAELGCNQFRALPLGDEIEFQIIPDYQRLDDEFAGWGGSIVEQTAPGAFLGISGTGRGRIEGHSILVTLEGRLWYSPAESVFRYVDCNTRELRLVFSRK